MNKKKLLKSIQYILSHDYLKIELHYPGINRDYSELNASEVLRALEDIDQFCADRSQMSKPSWIEQDQEQYDKFYYNKKEYQDYINERHRGVRFYAWREHITWEINPYRQSNIPIDEFKKLDKETQREHLEMKADCYSWDDLRSMVLLHHGEDCFNCGKIDDPAVDHILPKSKYPELEKDFMNLQVLCRPCNSIKGNRHFGYLNKNKVSTPEHQL
jgi:5-methylcytosine-specific restriction endonuclease McrA